MDDVIIKSSGKISLIVLIAFVTYSGYLVSSNLGYTFLVFLGIILIIFLIGNKTVVFGEKSLESFYSRSPFKRRKKILYKKIFLVEIFSEFNHKSLIINYNEDGRKGKVKISITNSIDKLDDLIQKMKNEGVSNFNMNGY